MKLSHCVSKPRISWVTRARDRCCLVINTSLESSPYLDNVSETINITGLEHDSLSAKSSLGRRSIVVEDKENVVILMFFSFEFHYANSLSSIVFWAISLKALIHFQWEKPFSMAMSQWLNHSAAVLPTWIHVYYLYHLPVIFQAKMVEGKAEKEEGEKIAKS